MRRFIIALLLGAATLVGFARTPDSGVRAVVRTNMEAAGAWGGVVTNSYAARANGQVVNLTSFGDRFVTEYPNPPPGAPAGSWIVDFSEQKTYRLLPGTRDYTVETFADVRRRIATVHQVSENAAPTTDDQLPSTGVDLPAQSRGRARRFEYAVTTQETGQRKEIAGHAAREVVLTISACEAGKTLEKNGGWVVTSTLWLASRIAPLDELVAAQRQYVRAITKGVYDAVFTQVEFRANEHYDAHYPEHTIVGARVIAETEKLDGTVLSSNTVYEMERTADEMKSAQSHYEAQQKRLAQSGARILGGAPPKRTRLVTMSMDYVSIDFSVTEADVAVPPGYTLKKK